MAPFYSSQTNYTGAAVWDSLEQVGRCEAHRNRAKVAAFLATAPGAPAEETAFKALFGNNVSCLGDMSELRVPRYAIRGALAEGLYKAEDGQRAIGSQDQIDMPGGSPAPGFADCYVRAHPAQVRSMLMSTTVASRQEHDAMIAMAPDFAACLPQGERLQFTPTVLRFAFAQSLYTIARKIRVAPALSSAAAPEPRL